MSNDLTGNPMVVDTAATITTTPTFIKKLVWTPTADGDDILISSNDGTPIWSYKAIAGDTNEGIEYEKNLDMAFSGLIVTTIDTGTLSIYLR